MRVFKKLREGIAVLEIPLDALRSNASGRKCRASKAVVLALPDGCKTGTSQHDPSLKYVVGQTVAPTDKFDADRWNECAPGIHFFLTRIEAENY